MGCKGICKIYKIIINKYQLLMSFPNLFISELYDLSISNFMLCNFAISYNTYFLLTCIIRTLIQTKNLILCGSSVINSDQ